MFETYIKNLGGKSVLRLKPYIMAVQGLKPRKCVETFVQEIPVSLPLDWCIRNPTFKSVIFTHSAWKWRNRRRERTGTHWPRRNVVRKVLPMSSRGRENPRESKVAQLELVAPWIDKQILWLNISMHNTIMMAPVYRATELVNVPDVGSVVMKRLLGAYCCPFEEETSAHGSPITAW